MFKNYIEVFSSLKSLLFVGLGIFLTAFILLLVYLLLHKIRNKLNIKRNVFVKDNKDDNRGSNEEDLLREIEELKIKNKELTNTIDDILTNEQSFRLTSVNKMLTSILEINLKNNSVYNAGQSILSVLNNFYDMDNITLFVMSKKTGKLKISNTNVDSVYHLQMEKHWNSQTSKMVNSVKVQKSETHPLSYPTATIRGIRFSNFTLLKDNDTIIGALLLENRMSDIFKTTDDRMSLYNKVLDSTSLVLQNVIRMEEINKMTYTDKLTGIYNRRYIDLKLNEEVSRHINIGSYMSVSLFDIDKFKLFNDTYGHLYGDFVLESVAKIIKGVLSKELNLFDSWIARYGGEEFIIYYPDKTLEEATKITEYIRIKLEQTPLSFEGVQTNITASFGVYCFNPEKLTARGQTMPSYIDIIANADKAMYIAKNNGRNNVVAYTQ